MRAVVLAAEQGEDLEPLTADVPVSMVPVLDRPVLEHTVGLLHRQGVRDIVAVVGYNSRVVTRYFGDGLRYQIASQPLPRGDGPLLVLSASVLTDLDVREVLDVHRAHGAPATAGPDGALYVLDAEAADGVTPLELRERFANAVASEVDDYWLPLRTPADLRRGVFDLLVGELELPVGGVQLDTGLTLGEGTALDDIAMIEPPVWIGSQVQIGEHVRLQGPLVVGDGATIGDGTLLRDSVVMPGATLPRETILIGAIAGHARVADSLYLRYDLA